VTSDDTLSLVLETLSVVVQVDKGSWITTELANSLVLAVLEVWNNNNKGVTRCIVLEGWFIYYSSDPIFLSILTDILESLASSPANGVYETVVKQALPPLSNAIANAKPEESWIAGSGIELVSSLIRGSPPSGLGEGFFALLAPNLFKCLTEAEDRDILQVSACYQNMSSNRCSTMAPAEWNFMSNCHYPEGRSSTPLVE
jgi:importin-9